jgi:D-3-phosphoglycerate dehydrogenase
MRILHLDANHPLLIKQLDSLGYTNDQDYTSSKIEIESKIHLYDGCILRSRFTIDEHFLNCGKKLKFIGRVGAGLENIDGAYAKKQGIRLIAAPEGNSNAVGEHALGMLLSLFNNLNKADLEIRNGKWLREENRGLELEGKIIGIIGYGNMGKSFAKKLRGFDVQVLCYDLAPAVGDDNCLQTSLENIQNNADILSIHTPQTDLTKAFINSDFIHNFKKNFWIINTARGSAIVTKDLVNGLKSGKILGAALDVLEYEKTSFETLFSNKKVPEAFDYLIKAKNVLLSPHIAGWTFESNIKLAQTIVDKIKFEFPYFILKNI